MADPVVIDFSGYEFGTPITTQYESLGVTFPADVPTYIRSDGGYTVLSGVPLFQGDIRGVFSRTVNMSVRIGWIDTPDSTWLIGYLNGVQVGSVVAPIGREVVTLDMPVDSFRVTIGDYESAGYAIDDLTFTGAVTTKPRARVYPRDDGGRIYPTPTAQQRPGHLFPGYQ